MNELDRLLKCVTLEPAYGPAFYRALLEESVYALIPAGAVITPAGTIRFIMWLGEDGRHVIPFFSNRSALRRVLTAETQAVRLQGRTFLEASRGAMVVLNPNEKRFCRLSAPELALLLDTGSPNAADHYLSNSEMQVVLQTPDVPAELLNSLSWLLSQYPDVERAYLVTMQDKDVSRPMVWLVAILIDADDAAQLIAGQMSALLADMPPASSVDVMRLRPGDETSDAIESHVPPFYDRAFGAKVVMDASAVVQ